MDKRKGNETLCCVPGHPGITGNEEADEEAKRALEETISNDEKYPPEYFADALKRKWWAVDKEGGKKGRM
jgi:hypothetical protein